MSDKKGFFVLRHTSGEGENIRFSIDNRNGKVIYSGIKNLFHPLSFIEINNFLKNFEGEDPEELIDSLLLYRDKMNSFDDLFLEDTEFQDEQKFFFIDSNNSMIDLNGNIIAKSVRILKEDDEIILLSSIRNHKTGEESIMKINKNKFEVEEFEYIGKAYFKNITVLFTKDKNNKLIIFSLNTLHSFNTEIELGDFIEVKVHILYDSLIFLVSYRDHIMMYKLDVFGKKLIFKEKIEKEKYLTNISSFETFGEKEDYFILTLFKYDKNNLKGSCPMRSMIYGKLGSSNYRKFFSGENDYFEYDYDYIELNEGELIFYKKISDYGLKKKEIVLQDIENGKLTLKDHNKIDVYENFIYSGTIYLEDENIAFIEKINVDYRTGDIIINYFDKNLNIKKELIQR